MIGLGRADIIWGDLTEQVYDIGQVHLWQVKTTGRVFLGRISCGELSWGELPLVRVVLISERQSHQIKADSIYAVSRTATTKKYTSIDFISCLILPCQPRDLLMFRLQGSGCFLYSENKEIVQPSASVQLLKVIKNFIITHTHKKKRICLKFHHHLQFHFCDVLTLVIFRFRFMHGLH